MKAGLCLEAAETRYIAAIKLVWKAVILDASELVGHLQMAGQLSRIAAGGV